MHGHALIGWEPKEVVLVILTLVKLSLRPEVSDSFPFLVDEFTRNTRQQPGNLWCHWSRNVENPDEYLLVEAFADAESAIAHAESEFFVAAMKRLPRYLTCAPYAINADLPVNGWTKMADLPYFLEHPAYTGQFS